MSPQVFQDVTLSPTEIRAGDSDEELVTLELLLEEAPGEEAFREAVRPYWSP